MHYKLPKLTLKINSVDKFLEEIGEKKEIVEELSIQKKDLDGEKMKVVVMKHLSK